MNIGEISMIGTRRRKKKSETRNGGKNNMIPCFSEHNIPDWNEKNVIIKMEKVYSISWHSVCVDVCGGENNIMLIIRYRQLKKLLLIPNRSFGITVSPNVASNRDNFPITYTMLYAIF